MAKAVLSERAVKDLQGIADYTLAQFGIGQTLDYDVLIDRALQIAANFPSIGKPYATQKGRIFQKYNVGRHAVFYQPEDGGIFIVRVAQIRRMPRAPTITGSDIRVYANCSWDAFHCRTTVAIFRHGIKMCCANPSSP